jgi:hypothetical protein
MWGIPRQLLKSRQFLEEVFMKKVLFTVLLLLSMLAATTGDVFAGSALELTSVTNSGGGPMFTFRVNGEFSRDELKGIVRVSGGGDDFILHCAQKDETTVVCHATKKISGQAVSVTFGGATFWANVPEQRIASGGTQNCYGAWANVLYQNVTILYDSNGDPSIINSSFGQAYGWQDYGPICQDEPGVSEPTVGWDHFILDTSNGKAFLWFRNDSWCGQIHGPAYYALFC